MALIAILDANVLWPQSLRDTLIRLAIHDLYRAAWTSKILDEMGNSLLREHRKTPEQVQRTRALMTENCPHMLVEGYEGLIPAMTNDPKDRHVLAAAVRINADGIVTFNVKDFPGYALEPYGIELHTPDDFLSGFWISDAKLVARILIEQAEGLKRPPLTVFDLVTGLGKYAPEFSQKVLESDDLECALQHPHREVPPPSYRTLGSL
jgi:predicted nucleic acid-binding protein